MRATSQRFWPFDARTGIITALAILSVGIVSIPLSRAILGWPGASIERFVLAAVFIAAALPILLMAFDVLAQTGGSVEYKGLKLNFSQLSRSTSAFSVPTNIGVRGEAVTDSSTTEILDTLRSAVSNDIVVIDLEDGTAWWETRLLVLLAGAVRLGSPEIMVFVATKGGRRHVFQGWAPSESLLHLLLEADSDYRRIYHSVQSAARQWALVPPGQPFPPWIQGLALTYQWMASAQGSDLPNELAAEQLLASELGDKIESPGSPRTISMVRLEELFAAELRTDSVDEDWDQERQNEAFLTTDASHLTLTRRGEYVALINRMRILNAAVRSLLSPRAETPTD